MSWKEVHLGELCSVITKGTTPSNIGASFTENGIKYIRSEMLTSSKFVTGEFLHISQDTHNRLRRSQLQVGDILFSMAGVYLGKTAILRQEDVPANTNQAVAIIRVDQSKCNNEYVYYFLNIPEVVKTANTVSSQSAQPNINLTQIGQLIIKLPPVEVQERIVDILSAYDDLIENNRKQIKLLEEAAQRLYKEWFIDLRFPGYETTPIHNGIPEGWMCGELGAIAFDIGKNAKKENAYLYSCYLPIDCLPRKSLAYTEKNDISLAESSLVGFNPNDILFGAMRPYFHKVVVARDNGLTRSTCFVINSKEKEYWAYLLMLLFSEDTVDYATKISVGTTMPYVRWKDFVRMPTLIPSKTVCCRFHEIVAPIINQISKLATCCEHLIESRNRLLPKIINGEMEIKKW